MQINLTNKNIFVIKFSLTFMIMLNRFQIATNVGSHMFDISVKASMMS